MPQALIAFLLLMVCLLAGACSSAPETKKPVGAAASAVPSNLVSAQNRDHPLAKYIELAGWRVSEKGRGKLQVQCGLVNHSEADVTDLGLNVSLRPSTAKAEDPAFCVFTIKGIALGPQEMKNVNGECATNLRVYELPDWQFIRPTFQITSPTP